MINLINNQKGKLGPGKVFILLILLVVIILVVLNIRKCSQHKEELRKLGCEDMRGKTSLQFGDSYFNKGKYSDAKEAYQKAIKCGDVFSRSYELLSDPKPDAKMKWALTYGEYFNKYGIACAYIGECEEAWKAFNSAMTWSSTIAFGDQGTIESIFINEGKVASQYRERMGAYIYNRALMSKILGDEEDYNEGMQYANKVGYDKNIVLNEELITCN